MVLFQIANPMKTYRIINSVVLSQITDPMTQSQQRTIISSFIPLDPTRFLLPGYYVNHRLQWFWLHV